MDIDPCSTPRRRSLRLKTRDVTTPKIESQTEENLSEALEGLASQITVTLSKVNTEQLLEKLNEECKIDKRLKQFRHLAKSKTNVLKINHKISAGKIVKKTFKEQQNEIIKKLKYQKMIQKLKRSNKRVEVSEQVEVSIDTQLETNEAEQQEVLKEPEVVVKASFEEIDQDLPLSILVKSNTQEDPIETIVQRVIEPVMEPIQSTDLDMASPIPSVVSTPTAASKTISNFSEIAAATSESTAVLIQKLNSTPTTSILKKKALQAKINASASKSFSLSTSITNVTVVNDNNLTPNKRRVSFCESVQIEEIEPNANKSLFRTTPKMPNRAKLMLFNNNNTNRQVSSPLASSSSNSLLNSSNPTPSNASTTEPKLNMSLNASPTIQATKVGFNTSLNTIASQFKSNRLSACEPISSTNPLVPTAQMSPSSSLINFFSNNKQSFLSQRSTIIQQQMLHLNSNKPEQHRHLNLKQWLVSNHQQKLKMITLKSNKRMF